MAIKAGEIFRVKMKVRNADYFRPVLVLRSTATELRICCFSTKFELMGPGDLAIDELDPSFVTTGLSEPSYLILDSEMSVPIEFLKNTKKLGFVSGEIKRQIEEWWGAPLL